MLIKTKRFLWFAIFVVTAIICLSVALSVDKPAFAETEETLKNDITFTVQTDFVVDLTPENIKPENVIPASSFLYGGTPNKAVVWAKRGEGFVIKFKEPIDTTGYDILIIGAGKVIQSEATYAFYKNASGESIAKDTVKCTLLSSCENYRLALNDYTDENGMLESIVLQHVTDESSQGDDGSFQVFVYNITLSTLSDYKLNVKEGDVGMTDGNVNVYDADNKSFTVHHQTEKLYCNEFSQNSAVELKFPSAIDTKFYKTLNLNLYLNGLSGSYTYYFELYKTSVTNISSTVPSAKISCENSENVNFDVDLSLFADEYGMVDGIVFYHYSNTRATDYNGLSLWVYASDVLVRQPEITDIRWPISVIAADYTNNFDGQGNNRIVMTFETTLFSDNTETEITDEVAFGAIARNIRINNVRLSDSEDLVKVITSYNGQVDKAAFIFKTDIQGDGSDKISFGSNLSLKVSNVKYLLKTDYEYSIVYDADGTSASALDFGNVLYVTSEQNNSKTQINIFFDTDVGEVSDGIVKEKLEVNGQKISALSGVTVSKRNDYDNVVVISVPSDSNILKNDGTDSVTVDKGFYTENFYVENEVSYYQYYANSFEYYLDTDTALEVYFVQNFEKVNGETERNKYATFEIKFSELFAGEEFVVINQPQFDKIVLNGEDLLSILAAETENRTYRAKITVSGNLVKVRVPIEKITGNDIIEVLEGFTLPQGGKVEKTVKFKYDDLYEQFVTVSDRTLYPPRRLRLTRVESDQMTDSKTSLFFTFGNLISDGFIILGTHEASLSQTLASSSAMSLSDRYVAQLAKYGVLDSVLDYIFIDGISVRQLMQNDKDYFGESRGLIKINYHGTGFNRGLVMSISISDGSLAILDPNTTHVVTLKEGFVTASLTSINDDVNFYYNTTTGKWQVRPFTDSVVDSDDNGKYADGCAGRIDVDCLLLSTLLAGTAVVITAKKLRRKFR